MTARLDQIRAELADIVAQGNSVRSKSPYDMARDVLNAPIKVSANPVTIDNRNWFEKLASIPVDIFNSDFSRKTFDILSRPLQFAEGAVTEIAKESQPNQLVDPGKVWNKAAGGFIGSDPVAGADISAAVRNKAPTEEHDWIDGLLGFGADVALDPLTYIPVAWPIKGLKLAGKLLPEVVKTAATEARTVKFAEDATKVTDPNLATKIDESTLTPEQATSPGAADLVAEPSNATASTVLKPPSIIPNNAAAPGANVPTGVGTDIPGIIDWQKPELTPPGEITRSSEPLVNDPFATTPKEPKQGKRNRAYDPPVPTVPKGPTPEDFLKPLEEVQIPKYNKEQIPEPFHVTPESTVDDVLDVPTQMKRTIADKIIETNPATVGWTDKEGVYFNEKGRPVTDEEWEAQVIELADDPAFYEQNIGAWDKADNPVDLSVATFAKGIERGVHPAPKGTTISYQGDYHPVEDVIKDLHDTFNTAEDIVTPRVVPGKTTAYSKEERAKWKEEISKVVDPEDLALFAQKGVHQYGAYSKNVQSVLGLKRAARTLDEVEAALVAGHIDKKTVAKLLSNMGVKTFDEAKAKLSSLEKETTTPNVPDSVDLAPGMDTPGTAAEVSTARTATPEAGSEAPTPEVLMSPEDIINHAESSGDTTLVNGDKKPVALTAEQRNDVFEALKDTGFKQFTEEGLRDYINKTKGGARTTSPIPYEGLAHKIDNFNNFKTLTLWNGLLGKNSSIWKRIPDEFNPEGIAKLEKGSKEANAAWDLRGKFLYDEVVPELKAAELTIKSYGIEPILGKGFEGLPLSMHDVIMAFPRKFSERYLFSGSGKGSRHIPPTQILEAVRTTLAHIHLHDGNADFLKIKNTPDWLKWRNEISKILKSKIGASDATARETPFNMWIKAGLASDNAQTKKFAGTEFERVIQSFAHAGSHLEQALNANWARLAMERGTYVQRIAADVTKRFGDDAKAAINNSTEQLGLIDNLDKIIEASVKEAGKVPPPDVVETMIKPILVAKAAEEMPVAEMKTEIANAKAVVKAADDPVATAKASTELLEDAEKIVEEAHGPVTSTGMERVLDLADELVLAGGARTIRLVGAHVGVKDLRPTMLNAQSSVRSAQQAFAGKINAYGKEFTREEQKTAWHYYQNGADPAMLKDPRIAAALKGMQEVASWAVNPVAYNELGIMNRVGATAAQINRHFDRVGLGRDFHFDGRKKNPDMLGWKDWKDIKDPLDTLSKVNAAVFAAHVENLTGASISRMGSKLPQEGYVRIVSSSPHTVLDKVIDTSRYYSEPLAKQMHLFDKTWQDALKPESSNPLFKFIDGTTKSLKTQYTIYRFGHHVRNTLGDMWLSYMAGMTNPRYYKRGADVIKSRREFYPPETFIEKDAKGVYNITQLKDTHAGKKVEISNGKSYDLMKATGNFPDMAAIEDVADPGAYNFTEKFIRSKANPMIIPETLTKGKFGRGSINRAASRFSEIREHSMRAPHWLYVWEHDPIPLNPKLPLEEALMEKANRTTAEVRKWHPDGSDLTGFERKGPRRVILFYSWIRKAAPLVLYGLAIRPGRFTMYNKATTEFANANGIDVDFGDPFPKDQLYPSWLKDSSSGPLIGMAGQYFGINPGIPGVDVLSDYSPKNIKETVLGGLNPFIKYPGQVVAHSSQDKGVAQNWQTGGNYGTWVDLLTSGLPNSGLAETVMGQRWPGRTPEAGSNRNYESQLNLPGGFTLGEAQIAGANWITGLGISDMSKPSYIQSALKDRQRAARDRAMEQRG